ncbi:MAG: hypothetical protein BIFFINMI_04042 [Phycisphaerae bacterium]|nr:hypothetical protein [Phycisphaerae bacterium]
MAKASRYKYFQPQQASRLGKLSFVARMAVEGFITGLHKSPHRGVSVEFAEHREYSVGDEIRHLDWKALARTDRYYIKQFEQETNLRTHILLDVSGSMDYASGDVTKLEYGCYLTAMMAYLMARQQDMVGFVAFDEAARFRMPPGSTPAHLDELFKRLEGIQPGKLTRIGPVFHDLAEQIHKRGLVIIVSDLYDDPKEVMRGLRHFVHKKHQVILFHVMDRAELDLPFNQLLTFVDMEDNSRIQVDPKMVRDSYKEQVQQFLAQYRRDCADSGIEYVVAATDTPYDVMLRGYLARRQGK